LFVKIEAFNPLGSVKDRLALGVIEAAEKSGELKPGQTEIALERLADRPEPCGNETG
jgi:cysteine synthase